MTQTFDSPVSAQFEVDQETRTIRGLALPYGVTGKSKGSSWQFAKGSLTYGDVNRVKVLVGHDFTKAVGVVTALDETDDGLQMTARIAKGPLGDEVLSMAAEGVWDGLSVGLGEVQSRAVSGINHVTAAPLREVSVTPMPSFDDARLTSVAASADNERLTMTDQATETPGGLDDARFTQLGAQLTEAITAGFEQIGTREQIPVISAGAPIEVNESPCYRFDGGEAEHDFSTDLIAFGRDRDAEAGERVMAFMREEFSPENDVRFAVSTGNVTTVNPQRQRPDMYVDERRFNTPLLDALSKGAITDMTPFVVPRFNSAADLVNDHAEGVEPTSGSFTTTSQTITPGAVSGKVTITREVWDQGGNPQVSGMIWAKMQAHYRTALEAKAFALLSASNPAGVNLAAGAADVALVNAVEQAVVDLNFVAGGNTFNLAATHANLYRQLAAAVDGSGRKLLPQYGPANANGQSRSKFASLDVAGTEFLPVPSLGAASGNSSKSYLIDTSAVHVWHSAPQRLEFQNQVAVIELAIWGYVASAITDLAGLRVLNYDPTA